jgi:hypothetical protein
VQVTQRTVGADDPVLDRLQLTLLKGAVHLALDPFPILRMDLLEEELDRWRERSRLEPKNPEEVVGPDHLPGVAVQVPTAHLGDRLGPFE